jgi:VWFA-related protein
VISAHVNWVRIPVSATDERGASITGLSAGDFVVLEDGQKQEPLHLSLDEGPVSLGIVFDASSSMEDKMTDSRLALRHLFEGAMPEDEYALVQFSDAPRVLSSFTSSSESIEQAASHIQPERATALFDAVLFSAQKLRLAKNQRKALFVLSDGADNVSRYSERELLRYAQEMDVAIYSVAIRTSRAHAATLRHLAEATGGASAEVREMNGLAPAVAQLNRLMRSHYLLGYVSNQKAPERDGLSRRVEVRLSQQQPSRAVHLNWRHTYRPLQAF